MYLNNLINYIDEIHMLKRLGFSNYLWNVNSIWIQNLSVDC